MFGTAYVAELDRRYLEIKKKTRILEKRSHAGTCEEEQNVLMPFSTSLFPIGDIGLFPVTIFTDRCRKAMKNIRKQAVLESEGSTPPYSLQVHYHHPPGRTNFLHNKNEKTESKASLIISVVKEEIKSLGWLHWPVDALVTVFGWCSTDFRQLRIRPEHCPSNIKCVSAVTPVFSSVPCFTRA